MSTRKPATVLHTPQAAADRLGCSEAHIRRLIASGELEAVDISQPGARRSKTRVPSDVIDRYIDARRRRARPVSHNPKGTAA